MHMCLYAPATSSKQQPINDGHMKWMPIETASMAFRCPKMTYTHTFLKCKYSTNKYNYEELLICILR